MGHPRLIFAKPLGDIKNKRIRSMVNRMIAGEKNAIADCMSRLTRRIREAEHFTLNDPILADYSTVKKSRNVRILHLALL